MYDHIKNPQIRVLIILCVLVIHHFLYGSAGNISLHNFFMKMSSFSGAYYPNIFELLPTHGFYVFLCIPSYLFAFHENCINYTQRILCASKDPTQFQNGIY